MKIKVGGMSIPEDIARVEAALKVIGDSTRLAVDANAGFDRNRALAYAKALAPYRLRWFEEPTDPLDFALLSEIAALYDAPIGTGENLFSTQDVRNLITFGGLRADRDIIQTDVPQSYGIAQFAKTLAMMKERGWSPQSVFSHGGNQMTLHIVGGFGLVGIPLLSLTMDPISAGAIIAPLLIPMDLVALRYFPPRTWSKPMSRRSRPPIRTAPTSGS